MNTKTKLKNALTAEHRTKLTVWMVQNESVVRESSDAGAAQAAQQALGFPVTTYNLASLRETIFPDIQRKTGSPIIALCDAMEKKIAALTERLTALETALGGAGTA